MCQAGKPIPAEDNKKGKVNVSPFVVVVIDKE